MLRSLFARPCEGRSATSLVSPVARRMFYSEMRTGRTEYGLVEALVAVRQLLLKTRKGTVHSCRLVPAGRAKHVSLLLK